MITAGLLISLDIGHPECGTLTGRLADRAGLTLGEPEGRWLPAAAEAADEPSLRELHEWIASRPGVAFVDVVHVAFEALSQELT